MSDERRMLACLALSPRVSAVAGEAVQLARSLSVRLDFLHVGEDTPPTRQALEDLVDRLSLPDCPRPEVFIEGKYPDKAICEVARRRGSLLIVAGALEKDAFLTGIFGSVARRVARTAPCSVLLMVAPTGAGSAYRNIVVGVEYDAASQAMLRFTLDFARCHPGGTVHVVVEYATPAHHVGTLALSESERATLHESCRAVERDRLADFLAPLDREGVRLELVCLEPDEEGGVVEYARRAHADLLVIPAPQKRLTYWDRFFHHRAESALKSLPCALLLFRDISAPPHQAHGENAWRP